MEIYTPNHGRFIDTLFTYGFIKVLDRIIGSDELKRIKIYPMGDYYLIKNIDEFALKNFYKELLPTFKENYYSRAYVKNGRVLPLLGFQDEEKVIKKIMKSLSDISSLKLPLSKILFKIEGTAFWRESPCKQHIKQLKASMETLPMVSAPYIGKYRYIYNKNVPEAKPYKVCPLCASLIYLGLLASSYSVKYRNVPSPTWEYAILIPTIKCDAKIFISPTQNRSMDTKKAIWCEEIPEIVLPILLLYPESITFLKDALSLSPILYSYRLVQGKRMGVWAVRSTTEHILENFIDFFLNVKLRTSPPSILKNLMMLVKDSMYAQAFTNLAFSIINKDMRYFYLFLREIVSHGKQSLLDESFVNSALKFFK